MLKDVKVLMLGGNGFLGNYIALRLSEHLAKVTIVSRRQPPAIKIGPHNNPIHFLNKQVSKPQTLSKELAECNVLIYLIGILVDPTAFGVKQRTQKQPRPGTYEYVNRDLFKGVLKEIKSPKKVIYFSSNSCPPFLPLYLQTKKQAADMLLKSQHQGYIFEPGYVVNKYDKGDILSKMLCSALSMIEMPKEAEINEVSNSVMEVIANGYKKNIIDDEAMTILNQNCERHKQKCLHLLN